MIAKQSDNGSQSTLIREDFTKQLKRKGYSRTTNIGSIKDEPESVMVKEISVKYLQYGSQKRSRSSGIHIAKKNVSYSITKFTY